MSSLLIPDKVFANEKCVENCCLSASTAGAASRVRYARTTAAVSSSARPPVANVLKAGPATLGALLVGLSSLSI